MFSLPNQHNQFVNILKNIYNQLLKYKYSKNIAVDIIKKLLLNRFLLNPLLFYEYSINQIQQQQLINIFNKLRIYFYPKKAQKQGILGQGQRIQGILISIISNNNNNNNNNNSNSNNLSINNLSSNISYNSINFNTNINNLHNDSLNNINKSNPFITNSRLSHINNINNNNMHNFNNYCNKNIIYYSDRDLYKDYCLIYNDFIQKDVYGGKGSNNYKVNKNVNQKQKINENKKKYDERHNEKERQKQKSQHSQNSSYQLSFSFIKNNASNNNISKQYITSKQNISARTQKQQKNIRLNYNPQYQAIQQNPSIHTVLDKLNSQQRYNKSNKSNRIQSLASPASQKSRKTVHTQFSQNNAKVDDEISMIEQLVAARRQLGAARKLIDQRKIKKMKERQKFMYYFDKIHQQFQVKRRQIQISGMKVRTEIQLI